MKSTHLRPACVVTAATLALLLVAPATAYAVGAPAAPPPTLPQVIDNVLTWMRTLLVGLATFSLTIGGVRYLLAGGDTAQVEKAKTAVKTAGGGYALAILAPALVDVLRHVVG